MGEEEPSLAATALKHRRIEEARDELETPPDPSELLASARGETAPPRPAGSRESDRDWLPEVQLMLAAGTPRAAGVRHRRWHEPGGGHTATLVVDMADAATPVRVNFYRGGEPATDLAGQPAWLAGFPSTIDAGGNADFGTEILRQAHTEGRPATLRVGASPVPWVPGAGG
jgi:hypothetical protein